MTSPSHRFWRDARLGISLVPVLAALALVGCTRYQPYSAGDGGIVDTLPEAGELATGPRGGAVSDVTPATGAGSESAAQPGVDAAALSQNPAILGEAARLAVGREFEPVYFDQDSYELTFTTRRSLHEYANWLEKNTHVWVTLEGRNDDSGTFEYGMNLAMARAWAVKDRLAGLGVRDHRLFTISFGEALPVAQDTPTEPAPVNRQVGFLAFVAPEGGLLPPQSAGGSTPPPAEPLEPPSSFELP